MNLRYALFLAAILPGAAVQAQQTKPSCPYDSAHFDLFHPVPRTQLRPLRPDRPGVTESPFTVDAGHLQVEIDAVRLINTREPGQRSREWDAGYVNLKLGLSRRTDLQVMVPAYTVQKQRATTETNWQRHAGFGDVNVRLKHNFLGDDQEGPVAMSAVAYTRLPTGGQTGSGGVEYGLILPVNVELNQRWNFDVQLQSALNYDPEASHHYMLLAPSAALDHEFNDVFSFLVEGVTQWDAQHSGWRTSLNLAPIFTVSDNLQFDLGTHLALNRGTDQEFFLGFTFRR